MMEIEKKSKEKELTEEDFPWEPWHAGCYPLGVYTLLFDKREDRIRGVKFTILNQWEEITPMCRKEGAKTEAYILFCQQYDDIIGPLSYEEVERNYLRDAILKRVPEMTKQQLLMIWDDISLALKKRTQEKWNCEKKLENESLMQTDRNTV